MPMGPSFVHHPIAIFLDSCASRSQSEIDQELSRWPLEDGVDFPAFRLMVPRPEGVEVWLVLRLIPFFGAVFTGNPKGTRILLETHPSVPTIDEISLQSPNRSSFWVPY